MKKILKRFLGIFISLALVLSLMPCMSLTVYADTTKAYADYDVTTNDNKNKSVDEFETLQVTFNGKKWYIIEDSSDSATEPSVTLLAADTSFGTSAFGTDYHYNNSTVKGYLEEIVDGTAGNGKPNFSGVANAIKPVTLITYYFNSTTEVFETTENAKLYLLSVEEASSLPANVLQFTSWWWLRSPGPISSKAATVSNDGAVDYIGEHVSDNTKGVRPALKLDLSAVTFESGTRTFTVKPYVSLKNTTTKVHFNSMDWYLIDFDSTTVTLLAEKCVGASTFGTNNTYSGSTVEGAVNNYYTNSISAAAKTAVSDNKMFLLTTGEANAITNDEVRKCSPASGVDINRWWLCSPGRLGDHLAACVDGDNGNVDSGSIVSLMFGVRPALKLNLSSVYFSSASKEFTVNPYASLVNNTTTPVKFNGIDWYIIADNSTAVNAGTVTLLAKDPLIASIFHDSSNAYSTSTVKDYLEGLTTGSGSFAGVAGTIETIKVKGSDADSEVDAKLWLLSTTEANEIKNANSAVLKCSPASGVDINRWWLCSPGRLGDHLAACVDGDYDYGNVSAAGINVAAKAGVRPALQLNLPSVTFISVNLSGGENATPSGAQNFFNFGSTLNDMAVTYTANTGYRFPESSDYYTTTNGITVARTSDTLVTVSGTPTAVVSITVPDAVAIPATAPNITAQPSGAALTSGYATGATLTVEATAATDTTYNALTYQWYSCDDTSKTNPQAIDNATSASYTVPTGLSEGTYYYYCVVTATRTDNSDSATTTSSVATVTVNAATPPTPPKPNPPSPTPPSPSKIEKHSDNVIAIDEEKGIATVRDAVSGGTTEVPLYVITEGLTHRMYNPNSGEHFYTKNAEEVEGLVNLGWIHESGSDFTVVSATEEDAVPVYRPYNPNCGGMHFYTSDVEEAKYLKSIGWNYEGISHYVYKATSTKGTPQHRLYNPNSPSAEHLWTSDEAEVDMLIAVGWIYEGICWRIV